MNKYPLWKNILILLSLVIAIVYSLPNLYAPDPAVQISGESSAIIMDEAILQRASKALTDAGIEHFGNEVGVKGKSLLLRLNKRDDQLPAQRILQKTLGDGFVVALNLASTTPEWLLSLGASPLKLGLDLSGGVHFLMEVDSETAIANRLEFYESGIKRKLREEKIRGLVKLEPNGVIRGTFKTAELLDQAASVLRKEFPELTRQETEQKGENFELLLVMTPAKRLELQNYFVEQNLTTIRNRVNELGVAEPLVQRQGANRIVVELPGVQDTAEAKRILGKTANLEFRLEAPIDETVNREKYDFRNPDQYREPSAYLEREIIITGERVANATSSIDPEAGGQQVNITLDNAGGTIMHRMTRNNINRRLGVLFVERKTTTRYVTDDKGVEQIIREPYYEKKIISLATIRDALGVQFRITGLDNPGEASELALLLRAGALAAPMDFVEERTVGPSMGAENIAKGITSIQIGMGLVALFMIAYYKFFGVLSVVSLAFNLVLLASALAVFGATLTLPGIAGIVLTLGMAVDANVLIYSRIKEELANGMSPQSAIHAGFDRAFLTIWDSNLTTLIIGVILYAIGTGPIRGFAVVLSVGILTSMFSAVTGTRALVNLCYGYRRVTSLSI